MKMAELRAKKPIALANEKATGGLRIFVNDVQIYVPGWVVNIDSFRRWVDSEEFPKTGNIWWLNGGVWADMSKEQAFSHLDVKGAIFAVLYFIVKQNKIGRIFTEGFLMTNHEADLSGNPDGLFLSRETIVSDRIRLITGADGGVVEVQGSPDMVLEVVSDSSVKKDNVTLLRAYWTAGITEYWLVDARNDTLKFEILQHGPNGYKRTPKKHGWMTSKLFGKSFQLILEKDASGYPEYSLEVR